MKGDKPEAVFLKLIGEDSVINSLNEFLPNLEKLEGMKKEQFMEKAKNMPKVSQEEEEKDSKGLVFKEERFEMQKMCITSD